MEGAEGAFELLGPIMAHGGGAAAAAVVIILLLLVGGAVFYWRRKFNDPPRKLTVLGLGTAQGRADSYGHIYEASPSIRAVTGIGDAQRVPGLNAEVGCVCCRMVAGLPEAPVGEREPISECRLSARGHVYDEDRRRERTRRVRRRVLKVTDAVSYGDLLLLGWKAGIWLLPHSAVGEAGGRSLHTS